MTLPSNLGSKLGPRLAQLMAQSVIATRTKLAPHEVSTTLQVQDKFFRIVAGEVGRTVSVLSRRIAADPDASPMIRQTFGFMANATGQWAALMNFAVYGSGLSQGIGGLLANELAPVVQKAFMLDPNAVHLPLNTLAQNTDGLSKDETLAVICAGGFRSSIATSILEQQGFTKVTNVVGGMAAWKNANLEVAA